jgi:hypothetical protein
LSPIERVDERFRAGAQNVLIFLGQRFGVTRKGVTRNCGIVMTFIGLVPLFGQVGVHPVSSAMTMIFVVMINGFFATAANLRGHRLLSGNEQWGTYTNWREWRWLRWASIFLLPPDLITSAAQVSAGNFLQLADLVRTVALLFMLYSITINELPPRQPRRVTAPRGAHAEAH